MKRKAGVGRERSNTGIKIGHGNEASKNNKWVVVENLSLIGHPHKNLKKKDTK